MNQADSIYTQTLCLTLGEKTVSTLSKDQIGKIIEILEKRGATQPCPRCGNKNFSILEGYFNQTLQTELKGMVIGGPSVPTVVVVCSKCGYISQHALGTLGLLPKEGEKVE